MKILAHVAIIDGILEHAGEDAGSCIFVGRLYDDIIVDEHIYVSCFTFEHFLCWVQGQRNDCFLK